MGILNFNSLCQWLPNNSVQVTLGCQTSGEVFKVLEMRKPGAPWSWLGSCNCISSALIYNPGLSFAS